ncbi:ATP-binding protein [Mesorhizobium sp. 8]|uniref:sensor histidine kinase n=1 Tax=Mesorhizobium sp. 8 TaxID=2584466 RepID=UPI00111F8413|nr:ATP-binding protein [Mesorhizobium sp. 8]QDC02400.1 two-component sensor histidine kinase [Mesorhizobium sp. 8]
MISRSFLSSIAFRLPFAIVFICVLVFSLATIAVFGLQRARQEMAAYGLQAFSSLAKASLVSRQVSDLVSSAPFLMNATSPYRVSSESRSVVAQVDALLRAMQPESGETAARGFASTHIVELLETIRTQTTTLASDADSAQQHKAEAAGALGEIAAGRGVADGDFRRRLNAVVQAAASSDSLFQLGELRRRYVAETAPRLERAAPDARVSRLELAPYERVFEAQTQYLLEMFSIRAAVARLHLVSRDLSHATETQSEAVARGLNDDLVATSDALSHLLAVVTVASLLVLAMAVLSIRSVMRVSRGIVSLSGGMNALAEGRKDVETPDYNGTETELVRLLEAFRAFRESVGRISRLRRTAEAAARTIRSTFRNMNEGIALFDPAGRPITMNRRVIELVGWSGSARKLPLRAFVAPIPDIDPALLPSGGEAGLLDGRFVTRHRRAARVTEVSLSRQTDGGIVLLARDVTEMDRREAEAARAYRLDGIMRMTHQVSHEVGNMIGIITGSLGLLEREEGGFSPRQKRHLARIRKAADRGRSLAASMLSVGSQQPIHPNVLELGALLRGMADVLEIAIGENCRLAFDIPDQLPTVLLDAALFEQSILNLCLNASAAMPEGGRIRISCAEREASVVVSVTDEGIGMSPEAVDKAFEPYFTTREGKGGAGLGLAMVYGFVRQSGGEANIVSCPGKGTKVEMTLPIAG